MPLSTITAFSFIPENSDATPGLFNRIFSQLSDNIGTMNEAAVPPAVLSSSTYAAINLIANSNNSDYVQFTDSSGARSNYLVGSHAGGTADGWNIFDLSGNTMLASFSKQSVRFFQQVVGPVFDVGGALADTLNSGTYGTGTDSDETRIQAAINDASARGISRVYIPASMYPYSASSISFIDTVQMVREGGNWSHFDIKAYGAFGDGVISDTSATNAAVYGARRVAGTVFFPAGGRYLQTGPIDLTFAAGSVASITRPVTIRAEGGNGVGNDVSSANIIIGHLGHGFDCSGSYDLIFENVNLTTPSGINPQTGWFLSRNTAGSSAGHMAFTNCKAWGNFTDSVVYTYGSEINNWDSNTYFSNLATGGKVFTFTGMNISALSSSIISIATGAQSNTVFRIKGNLQAAAAGKVFYLEGVSDLYYEGWMYSASGVADGHSLVYVDGSQAESKYCTFMPIAGENGTFVPQYGWFFSDDTRTHTFFTMENVRLTSRIRAVSAGSTVTCQNFRIAQFQEVGSATGLQFMGRLRDSTVQCDRVLIINDDFHNVLIGDPTNWTITSRTSGIHMNPTQGSFDGQMAMTSVLNVRDTTAIVRLRSSTAANSGYMEVVNGGGSAYFGVESSPAGGLIAAASGGVANAMTLLAPGTTLPIVLATNNAARLTIDSGGTLDFRSGRVVSMRTLAASSVTVSAANTNVQANEFGFTVGGASGASIYLHSGGTVYVFNSALSAKAT